MRLVTGLRFLGLAAVMAIALAACGAASTGPISSTGSKTSPTPTASPTPTPTPMPTATPTPTPAPAASFEISAVVKTVGMKQEAVLSGPSGMTLYYYTPDRGQSVTCTGSCAQAWPPLSLPAGSKPVGGSGISGTFGSDSNPAGGSVVTYNGWPLYRYSGDMGTSATNGQGIGGVWFVATPNLQPQS
jgi:predicted lipoprotein with Yx(FWY)xxD motif